jgi:hypothetical protein
MIAFASTRIMLRRNIDLVCAEAVKPPLPISAPKRCIEAEFGMFHSAMLLSHAVKTSQEASPIKSRQHMLFY